MGCANDSSQKNADSKEEEEDNIEEIPKLADGDYCANILYYNPKTGHRASYDLTVEVIENSIEKIYFCNGGHLDHFDAPELDENFNCSFISYEGIHWDVTVSETPCDPQENCTNEDLAIYEFGYLLQSLNVTASELKVLEKELGLSPDDYITLRQLKTITEYLRILRAQNALNAEVEAGFIEDVHRLGMRGQLVCQNAIVKRYRKFYLLEVMGQKECVMGAVDFDSNNNSWQMVLIKPDPNSSVRHGFQMRILESSSDFQYLYGLSRRVCTF
jgi:hypothetical protein